eukprot:m51a1_g9995 putative serine-threonine protein (429) ;mRNA; r:54729-56392
MGTVAALLLLATLCSCCSCSACSVKTTHVMPDYPTLVSALQGEPVPISVVAELVDPSNDSGLECYVRFGMCNVSRSAGCTGWLTQVDGRAAPSGGSRDARQFAYLFVEPPGEYEATAYCDCGNGTKAAWAGQLGQNLAVTVIRRGCGNGRLEPGEQCDKVAHCINCTCTENTVPAPGNLCSKCGNGDLDEGEQCDKTPGCQVDCTCAAGTVRSLQGCTKCGNGRLDESEECDVTNSLDDDCDNNCMCLHGPPKRGYCPSETHGVGALVAAIVGPIGGLVVLAAVGTAVVAVVLRRSSPRRARNQLPFADSVKAAELQPNSSPQSPPIPIPQTPVMFMSPLACGTTLGACGCGGTQQSVVVLDAGGNPTPVMLDGSCSPAGVTTPGAASMAVSVVPTYDVESHDYDSCVPDVIDPTTGSVICEHQPGAP